MISLRSMFAGIATLQNRGVLGINARNGLFLQRYNPRALHPLVDDKGQTKQLAREHGIATPKLFGAIRYPYQSDAFTELALNLGSFAMKPARGSGGEGIVVASERDGDGIVTVSGEHWAKEDLRLHLLDIIAGRFSLGGNPDYCLVEERVVPDPRLAPYYFQGVPDARIIVFFGMPVMAMLRLPTKQSSGKANLHQGALGVGVGIASGKTIGAVKGQTLVEVHPDTKASVIGFEVPLWKEMLQIAAHSGEVTGLNLVGVDIVLDQVQGPLVLELNARPGLSIQLANGSGLRSRLEKIESLENIPLSLEERVQLAASFWD